ncbi:MAG: hypothetical protein ISN28_02650 [Ectothiorhodospiraceae bacterium AqS1]|nr:hypothetical protein [Ectothiorhodospiraceae bacterium AqS1]
MDLPIALLARQWRDPPDDFEELVARTKTSLDTLMERIDGIGNEADLRAHRLIAGSLVDLLNTVISTGRKPTRIGSGIAKALEALLLADPRGECIGAVNELRGMLSTPMLSESSFFTLAPGAERLTQGFPDHDIHDRIKSVVGEGQREFQRGLWEWVSGNPDGLRRIASVLVAIDEAALGEHALWRIAARFSTLMAEENAAPGHALMRLVGQIDHQIRRFCAPGYKVERPPEALMHNLLFHIEKSGIDSETARLAKSEFALGAVFEIPAAGGGWPAAALSKTMELLLRVSTSLEDASPFRGEIAAIRRDLIRARDAMLLADRPDIARRMDRAVDCLGDPQEADLSAAAEIAKGVYKALGEGSAGAGAAESAPQDAAGRRPADLSRIPDFSRAKELMDRIDAAVVVGEPGLDEGEASEFDDHERGESDPGIGDARSAASALMAKPFPSAFDEKTPKGEDALPPAADLPSIAAKAPFPSAAGESFRSSDIESASGTDGGESEPPRRSENAIEGAPPHPSEAGRGQGQEVAEPLEARQGIEDKEAAFAGDDPATRSKPSSRFDPNDSALDILLDRVRTLGATHREIAKGVRKIGQGIARLERLAGIDAPSLDQKTKGTEEAFDRSGSPRAAEDAGDAEKARRLIPALRAIAAHTQGLLERGQREGGSLEKSVIGLRLVPLHIGIRRIQVIATRPRADGKRLSIDVRGEEGRCDPAVMDHLFPIIETVIETVIERVLEAPSHDIDRDRAGDPPAKLGLDFSIGRGSLSLQVIAKGRALGEMSLAKIRERIDKARGKLEILPSPSDRFGGLRVELPLTRWTDRVVVVRTKKARFALFAREVVAILRPPGSGRQGRQGIYRQGRDRVAENGAPEKLGAADPLDAKKADSRYLEGEEIAIADGLEGGVLESEGFEYEGDIYPLRAAFAGQEDDARRAKDDDAAALPSPSVALLRIGEKRASLLCEEIESAGECTLCALPPLVAAFAKSAVVFADGRAPAALIESETIIDNDSEERASAEAAEPS